MESAAANLKRAALFCFKGFQIDDRDLSRPEQQPSQEGRRGPMSYHPKIIYVNNARDMDGSPMPFPPDDSGEWIAIDVREETTGWVRARALHPAWAVPGGTVLCRGRA